jgi:HEAT repeat protein
MNLKKLINQLNNGRQEKKLHALEKLSEFNTPSAIEAIIEAFLDNDLPMKRHIFNVLDKMDKVSVNNIIKKYENRLYEVFVNHLNDRDWAVRSFAVKVLGRISGKNAMSPLIAMLNDREGYVRYFAAETIGKFCDISAIPYLADILMDEYGYMRTYILESLINVLQHLPESPDPHDVILFEETVNKIKKYNNSDAQELLRIIEKKIKEIKNKVKDFVIIPDNYPGERDFVIIEYT